MPLKTSKRARLILLDVGIACAVLALLACGFLIVQRVREYRAGTDLYEAMTLHVVMPAEHGPPGDDGEAGKPLPSPASGVPGENGVSAALPAVDFKALSAVNTDVAAWLRCPGTAVSYPVVHGGDNEYYLDHLFDGSVNRAGALFVDALNAPGFSDRNTIIYGHNMRDRSMFWTLMSYKEQTFYDEHPSMQLITPQGYYTLELFAGFVADAQQEDAWRFSFENGEDFAAWARALGERSTFKSGVEVGPNDRIVTLSTCTYETSDARFVVCAKLTAVQ